MIETFWSYGRYRWLKRAAIALLAAIILFAVVHPIGGRNGGTWVGYLLGTLGAVGIGYLTWYGMRKRSYKNFNNTLQECLSAHVWIGISLIFLVPLHSGFEFGFNVHTLAYALMVLVVLSGIWGALNYQIYAREVPSHRGGKKIDDLAELLDATTKLLAAAASKTDDAGRALIAKLDLPGKPSLLKSAFVVSYPRLSPDDINAALADAPSGQREQMLALAEVVQAKRQALRDYEAEIGVHARLKLWLYLHVPLTVGLWAALITHIVSVFYRW